MESALLPTSIYHRMLNMQLFMYFHQYVSFIFSHQASFFFWLLYYVSYVPLFLHSCLPIYLYFISCSFYQNHPFVPLPRVRIIYHSSTYSLIPILHALVLFCFLTNGNVHTSLFTVPQYTPEASPELNVFFSISC